MSFDLDLWLPVPSWDVAERLAEATRGAGLVALVPGRRRRWFRGLAPSVHLDWEQAQAVLDDQASWSEDEFALSEHRFALADTILRVARELPSVEWTLRCCWGGDEIRAESRVAATELAELVRASAVNRYVLYRVSSRELA